MSAYTVIGYMYNAGLHCPACAAKAFPGLNASDDELTDEYADANCEVYCAALDSANRPMDLALVPWRDREGNSPHAFFDYENENYAHGAECETCGAEIFETWCDGCEDCAPELTVCAENRDDDPWTASLTVAADSAEAMSRWLAHNGRTIDGDSWSQDGNHAYAMPSAYVGCAAEWEKEGYKVDCSQFCDDPLEAFGGMSDEAIDHDLAEYARNFGWDDETRDEIRADIAAHFAVTTDEWRADPTDLSFDAYREERVKAARAARHEEARLQAEADALQVKLPFA